METYYENAHRRSDLGHAHFRPRFHPAHPTVAAAPISRDKTTMVTTAGTLWRSGTGLTAGKVQSAATRRSERGSIHARCLEAIATATSNTGYGPARMWRLARSCAKAFETLGPCSPPRKSRAPRDCLARLTRRLTQPASE